MTLIKLAMMKVYPSPNPPSQEGGTKVGCNISFSIPLTSPSPGGTFKGKPCFILTQSLKSRMDNKSHLTTGWVEEKNQHPLNPPSQEGGHRGMRSSFSNLLTPLLHGGFLLKIFLGAIFE